MPAIRPQRASVQSSLPRNAWNAERQKMIRTSSTIVYSAKPRSEQQTATTKVQKLFNAVPNFQTFSHFRIQPMCDSIPGQCTAACGHSSHKKEKTFINRSPFTIEHHFKK